MSRTKKNCTKDTLDALTITRTNFVVTKQSHFNRLQQSNSKMQFSSDARFCFIVLELSFTSLRASF